MATLIKTDKNGTKYYTGMVTCDRCGGEGGWDGWKYTGYTCYKCGGTGKVESTWKEYTPEYEQKLAERRAKRNAKLKAEQEAKQAEWETIRKAKEEEKARQEALEKARKAVSQYQGEVGEKITMEGIFDHTAWFETHVGWMTQIMYIHTFKDANGNKFIWKTSSNSLPDFNYGEPVKVTGTIKDHSEYKEEKQTILTRCKVVNLAKEVL